MALLRQPSRGRTAVLLALAATFLLVVYHAWLNFHILSFADYTYESPNSLKDQFLNYGVWTDRKGLGAVDDTLWRPTFSLFVGAIGTLLGSGLEVADRFVVLWMWIPLSVVPPFLLARQITGSRIAATVSATVFAFNTYFLAINTQGHILLSLGAAWGVLATYLFVRATAGQRTTVRASVSLALALTVCGWYDLRFLYIEIFVLLLYALALTVHRRRDRWRTRLQPTLLLAAAGGGVLAFNAFWIAGDLASGGGTQALSRTLFGNAYWQLRYAVTLHHPFWNGDGGTWFQTQALPWWFWVVPVLALLGAGIAWPSVHGKVFTLLAVVGIFLAKQTAPPFGGVYPWLFKHFPGFNAFRESTKFYYLIALSYAILIGFLIAWVERAMKERRPGSPWSMLATPALAAGVIAIFMVNTIPLLNGHIGSMFRQRHVPTGYEALTAQLEDDPTYFRTLWAPATSRWSYGSTTHPAVSLAAAEQDTWSSLTTDHSGVDGGMGFFTQPDAQAVLSSASVRYVVVPIEDQANDDDLFVYYGGSRSFFVGALDKISWLHRVDVKTPGLDVYENRSFDPHVATNTPAQLTAISASEYRVQLTHLDPGESVTIFFGETYNRNWRLASADLDEASCPASAAPPTPTPGTTDCTRSPPGGGPLRALSPERSGIGADQAQWANTWTTSYSTIVSTFPKGSFRRNADGSVTAQLVIYFAPETPFARALVFSLLAVLLSCAYLAAPVLTAAGRRVRRRRRRHAAISPPSSGPPTDGSSADAPSTDPSPTEGPAVSAGREDARSTTGDANPETQPSAARGAAVDRLRARGRSPQ